MTSSPSSLPSRTADVAVIGSGIVGLSTAHHLLDRGLSCMLIDPKGPAGETSFGNAGSISVGNVMPQSTPGIVVKALRMLANPLAPLKLDWGVSPSYARWLLQFLVQGRPQHVLPIIDALSAINRASRGAWLALGERIQAQDLIAHTGYLHVYSEQETFEKGEWERDLMRRHGVVFDVLDAAQLRELEPGIGTGFQRAVFQRESLAMRDPGDFCRRLFNHLSARGATPLTASVSSIARRDGGYQVDTDHGPVHAGRVVVAAGAWSNALLRPFGLKIPVIPARGYHLMYPQAQAVVGRPTLWAERYMVVSPMQAGIRMTSIKELTALDRDPHYHLIRRLDPEARKLFPGITGEPVSEWAGNRPCTPDSLPIIDRVPGEEIFVATGHGHLGLTQGPVTGRLLDQMMAGQPTEIPLAPYGLARFA
ncbi:FAD-dependent oxidoreductase [Pseudoxanthomonas mexicana]|uniref:FAD-dependent oxidoreductase n=1 Tax=Pseudoxanthomonas mexicana TaxID=128785 RepID=A0ABX6R887_PSEMX|nr:FAD-dependent oxidoreductase [Pseudoxanthomonas mexicana]QND79430.1 FAD-dependent oxidoreductase [Pseudoxanthomonas mexicana]